MGAPLANHPYGTLDAGIQMTLYKSPATAPLVFPPYLDGQDILPFHDAAIGCRQSGIAPESRPAEADLPLLDTAYPIPGQCLDLQPSSSQDAIDFANTTNGRPS